MYDDPEPIYMRPYLPGHVYLRWRWFVVLCALALIGAMTLLFVLFQ